MSTSNSSKNFIGYSQLFEVPYIIAPETILPLTPLLTDDLKSRYDEVLNKYRTWCKLSRHNPNATTTYHRYCLYVRKCESNLYGRRFINLHIMLAEKAREIAASYASKKPPVAFVSVSKPSLPTTIDVKIIGTQQAIEARVVQSKMKDSITKIVADDPRPVLDLGGGAGALERSAKALNVEIPPVTNLDRKASPNIDFNSVDYDKFHTHQIVSNHSSYHFKPTIWAKIVKLGPKGVVLSLPSSDDYQQYSGEDYTIEARRIPALGQLEAYTVSGNIFSVRSNDGKGRVFKDEVWYSRAQWSKWGFSLLTFPQVKNDFIKSFFHGFLPPLKLPKKIPHRPPCLITLSNAVSVGAMSKKFPPINQLLQGGDMTSLHVFHGVDIYHTPKIDGVNMVLSKNSLGELIVVDRRGCYYRVVSTSGERFIFEDTPNFRLSVELLPQAGTNNTFAMYLDQVITNFGDKFKNVAEEIVSVVTSVNKYAKQPILGQKPYKLGRNKTYDYKPPIPADGMVYVPAISSTWYFPPKNGGMEHSFAKPFEATDTNTYVISSQVNLLRGRGTPLEVYYRERDSLVHPEQNKQIDTIMKKSHVSNIDFHDGSTVSPLLYEGFHIPAGIFCENDAFIVTHVRGDKRRQDVRIKKTETTPQLAEGVCAFTRYAPPPKEGQSPMYVASEVLRRFLNHLASSRIIKLLPEHVGVSNTFMASFMNDWNRMRDTLRFQELTKLLNGTIYDGPVDPLYEAVRKTIPYMSSMFFMDVLFRYPHVRRSIDVIGTKVIVMARFDISRKFEWQDIPVNVDLLGYPAVPEAFLNSSPEL